MSVEFTIQQTEFITTPGIKTIRETVFIKEQHVPVELEWDGLDDTATHVVARANDTQVIGTARMLANGHIGRMAVLPAWRHQGVGSAMLKELLLLAQRRHLVKVYLHAQTTAVGFYEQHGFKAVGEEFMDAGIPHRYMERTLS
jgi:predicted GNAT family N-acyltransferase